MCFGVQMPRGATAMGGSERIADGAGSSGAGSSGAGQPFDLLMKLALALVPDEQTLAGNRNPATAVPSSIIGQADRDQRTEGVTLNAGPGGPEKTEIPDGSVCNLPLADRLDTLPGVPPVAWLPAVQATGQAIEPKMMSEGEPGALSQMPRPPRINADPASGWRQLDRDNQPVEPAAAADRKWNLRELRQPLVGTLRNVLEAAGEGGRRVATGMETATGVAMVAPVNGADSFMRPGDEARRPQTATRVAWQPALGLRAVTQHAVAVMEGFDALAARFAGRAHDANPNGTPSSVNGLADTVAADPGTQPPDDMWRQPGGVWKKEPTGADPAGHEGPGRPVVTSLAPMPTEWSPRLGMAAADGSRMPSLIEQVRQAADYIAERAAGSIRVNESGVEANLRLVPPDLGQVRVSLHIQNNQVAQALFIAERPETAQLLDQHMREFREALSRHGVNVSLVEISVAARPVMAAQEGAAGQFLNHYTPRDGGAAGEQPRQESRAQQRQAEHDGREAAGREHPEQPA